MPDRETRENSRQKHFTYNVGNKKGTRTTVFMDNKTKIFLVSGLIVIAVLFFISTIIAGIALILLLTVIMSLAIMQDSAGHPDIAAAIREDAKAIVLTNTGNAEAVRVQVALVPLNIRFDLPSLGVDKSFEYPLDSMVGDVKVAITFENGEQHTFSRSYVLSAMGNEFEPLKPLIPLFGWK